MTESVPVQQKATGAASQDPGAVREAAAGGLAAPAGQMPYMDLIQRAFGRHDVSQVRAHTGGEATAAAERMGAEAYATGDDVVFGGAASLHTAAHEAAHVVQQRAGVQVAGGVGAPGDAWERHADAIADRVVRGESAEALLDEVAPGGAGGASAGGAGGAGGTVQAKLLDAVGDALPNHKVRQLLEGFLETAECLRLQRTHGIPKQLIEDALEEIKTKSGVRHDIKIVVGEDGFPSDKHYDLVSSKVFDIAYPKLAPERLLARPVEKTQAAVEQSNVDLMRALNHARDARLPLQEQEVPTKGMYYRDELPPKLQQKHWNGYADPTLFDQLGPFTFRVKAGVSAAAAITRFLEGFTVAECNSAVQATYYGTLLRAQGQPAFDQRFGRAGQTTPEGSRLQIQREVSMANPLTDFMSNTRAEEKDQTSTPGERPVSPGSWYYLGSSPLYKYRHCEGMWGGLNALYLDRDPTRGQLFGGMGDVDRTEAEVYEDLAAEFNKPPTAAELLHIFKQRLHFRYRGIFLPVLGNAGSLSQLALAPEAIQALEANSEQQARQTLTDSLSGQTLIQPLRAEDLGQSAPPPLRITAPWTTCLENGTPAQGEAVTHVSITLEKETTFSELIAQYRVAFRVPERRVATIKQQAKKINGAMNDGQKLAVGRKLVLPHPKIYLPEEPETQLSTGFRGTGRKLDASKMG